MSQLRPHGIDTDQERGHLSKRFCIFPSGEAFADGVPDRTGVCLLGCTNVRLTRENGGLHLTGSGLVQHPRDVEW